MRLYLKFFAMHLKSRMAYKRSFFFSRTRTVSVG